MFGTIRNAPGEHLDYTFTPGQDRVRDLVVIGHGVTSHKDRPWLIALSEALASAGIASMRISFSGNGGSEGRFEESTISKEVEDLGSVLDAADGWRALYCGHSMGGAVGVLRAAADPRIRGLVSLAGMVHVQEFMQRHFGHLRPGADVLFDKAECPLGQALLDDARDIGSVQEQGARIAVPWLLVHGTSDDIVPLQDSLDIRSAAREHPVLEQLVGADHRFTDHEDLMTSTVVTWIRKTLSSV